MDSLPENYIYPCAFNPCILRLSKENGKNINTLYMENTFDTLYVQLAFTEELYRHGEVLFRCDYMEAKDGGLPFLIVIDIIKCGKRVYDDQKYMIRYELVRLLLEDPETFDTFSFANEYRVRLPLLYDIKEINDVFKYVIPNMYGVAHGVAFTKDTKTEEVRSGDNQFLLRKTRIPEVYELYLDGATPVPGNNVAYIPNLESSKKIKQLLSSRNSIKLRCEYDEKRQKWVPEL